MKEQLLTITVSKFMTAATVVSEGHMPLVGKWWALVGAPSLLLACQTCWMLFPSCEQRQNALVLAKEEVHWLLKDRACLSLRRLPEMVGP